MRQKSAEDDLMSKLVGGGSRKGSTLVGRTCDLFERPPTWGGVAAVLAATGPRGRRAALRGSVCYLSAVVLHLPIKAVVGRKHPQRAALKQAGPFTSSFPSGHSASDLAFVLGASQELPLLSLPLSLATAAATWSLLRKRAHYPSDILAGALLGLGVAVAAWKLWPTKVAVNDATAGDEKADSANASAA